MHSLFISDLHLAPQRPAATEALLRFLDETAPAAERLYVLGDLFDYWIGDDSLSEPFNRGVADALSRLAARGVRLYFMHGNRDFLIGEEFSRATGMKLLDDATEVDLYGRRTLLMHGDALCTDDVDYQKLRVMVRDPTWQRAFLAKPIAERIRAALALRSESEQAKQGKVAAIMDVTPATVESVLRAHGCPRLIHGHTHRPARHEHVVDGNLCERFVLGDWYEQCSYLVCDAGGCRAVSIS